MFLQSLDDRINLWRDFRDSLTEVDKLTALTNTAELWAKAPFVSHYLIPDDVTSWPEPWDLLMEDIYCDTAVALGMIFTLSLSKFDHNKLFLKICPKDALNLVFYEDNILNYERGIVINTSQLPDNINFEYVYNYIDLRLSDYV